MFANQDSSAANFTLLGGTLGGTGTVAQIASTTGNISPGASPGILNSSNVTLRSTSFFTVELNGPDPGAGYDQLNVSGVVDLGNSTLNASLGFIPGSSSFTIINNDSNDGVIGTFNNLPNNTVFALGGLPFVIAYNGGDGNDVVLTRLRPPSTITNVVVAGTNVQFQVLGLAGFPYTIEASTNLVNWQAISTNQFDIDGKFEFLDPGASNYPARFYRSATP